MPGRSSSRAAIVAEPPAQFIVRPPVVVDASLICACLFEEAEAPGAAQLMTGKRLCAPRLLDQEVLNVCAIKARRGLAPESTRRVLADFLDLPIDLVDPVLDEQLALALRYGLSGYDAAYLWLAVELRAPLLTFDRKLGAAAQAHLQGLG